MASTPALDDAPATDAPTAPSGPSNVQRLVSGLGQSVVGPANIARALTGLGLSLTGRTMAAIYRLVRSWLAPAEVDPEQAITLSDGAPSRPAWRRPLLISAVVALVLAVGGVAFKLLRTPSAPPVAAEPPRVRPASGATGDSAPSPVEELEQVEESEEAAVESPTEEDPRKKGE